MTQLPLDANALRFIGTFGPNSQFEILQMEASATPRLPAADGVFQHGVVVVGCRCASEDVGSLSRRLAANFLSPRHTSPVVFDGTLDKSNSLPC